VTSRLVMGIGVGQLVNWGVLYYAFGVLLLPVERTLDAPQWIVAGAFSLALLVSAAVAPTIGHAIDRGNGPLLMTVGGFVAAALLGIWAAFPSITMLYVAWAGLGLSMASVLYEPAFAMVGRFVAQPAERLKSLAVVTVFGGLASTVFLPLTAMLVRSLDWRGAVGVLALLVAVATLVVSRTAYTMAARSPIPSQNDDSDRGDAASRTPPAGFGSIVFVFASATLSHAALTTTLVPALAARGISATTAAFLGSLMGLMQVFGRTLLMHGSLSGSPAKLTAVSLGLQAVGMALLAIGPSSLVVGLGIAIFAIGSGLTTLVRPYLVQTMFAIGRSGYLNGVLARAQQLARAAGPIAAVGIGSAVGYGVLFAIFAIHFGVLAFVWRRTAAAPAPVPERTMP
jgi:hypothetical protein